ncbi:MAG: type II secretion system GspH family protein [Gemmataceae bacterium]|nr:type II secretion system GspH family protein [Gemmataceae bacterium]
MKTLRTAFSLVELLAVLTILSIALAMGAVLLVSAVRTGSLASDSVSRVVRHAQLADALRDDITRALAVTDVAPGRLLLAMPEGRTVEYVVAPPAVRRVEQQTGGQSTTRDYLPGPADWRGEFARDGKLIRLKITEMRKGFPGVEIGIVVGTEVGR